MESSEILEIEQKYDVDASTPLPHLLEIPGVIQVTDHIPDDLESTYYDTSALSLATRKVTLRRRTGGNDEGWHLKFPSSDKARREIHAPLCQPDEVPAELLDHVLSMTRGEPLTPVVRLLNQRTTFQLYGAGSQHLAEFVDDHVRAERLITPTGEEKWREWELELVDGDRRLFAAAAQTLETTGATNSVHHSKLARALGTDHQPRLVSAPEAPRKDGPVVDVVLFYLHGQIEELLTHDAGIRLERPDAVHQLRAASRRMRSALSLYRGLFAGDESEKLRDELK